MVVSTKHLVRIPSLAIAVSVVGGVSASLGLPLLGLQPLVSLAVGGVEQGIRGLEGVVCGCAPVSLI